MRRTKEWWARLTKQERSELVWLEKSDKHPGGYSGYLPDGYRDCGGCSTPTSGSLCTACLNRLIALIERADKEQV